MGIPTNASCTIYCMHKATEKFYKHIINDVFWAETDGNIIINKGKELSNNLNMYCDPKEEYLSKAQYQKLTDTMNEHFTLSPGDLLIFGAQSDAPDSFDTNVKANKHFGADEVHEILSVKIPRWPNGEISHMRAMCD